MQAGLAKPERLQSFQAIPDGELICLDAFCRVCPVLHFGSFPRVFIHNLALRLISLALHRLIV
jgi:hypothetical protein